MLWNIVYEFFIKYIFGGIGFDGTTYQGLIGYTFGYEGNWEAESDTSTLIVKLNGFYGDYGSGYWSDVYCSLGNYLSLIATIISMVAIVLICCALIKKIYNMCAHIIG